MAQNIIEVENLSKLYKLGKIGTGTLSHDLNRIWYKVTGKEDPYLKLPSKIIVLLKRIRNMYGH